MNYLIGFAAGWLTCWLVLVVLLALSSDQMEQP